MASFGCFSAVVKGELTFDSDGIDGSLPTRRDGAPTRYENVLPIERQTWTSLKVSCLSVHCDVCNRRRRDLFGIVGHQFCTGSFATGAGMERDPALLLFVGCSFRTST